MSLNQGRLKGKIVAVLNKCQAEDTDPNSSRDLLADRLATAIIDEVKNISIEYTSGLTTAAHGLVFAVGGELKVTIS